MKNQLLAVLFSAVSTISASAQIDWQFTGGPAGGNDFSVCFDDSAAFFGDRNSLFRTADAKKWQRLPIGNLWPLAAGVGKIAAFQGKKTFLVSADRGETWLAGELPPFGQAGIRKLAVAGSSIFALEYTEKRLFQTQDDGLTWDSIALPAPFCDGLWAFGDQLFVGGGLKIWQRTANGWSLISPALDPGDDWIGDFFAEGSAFLLTSNKYTWISLDGGANWTKSSAPDYLRIRNFTRLGSRIYGRDIAGGLIWTTDFGQTWQGPASPSFETLARAGGKMIGPMAFDGAMRFDEAADTFATIGDGLVSGVVFDLELAGQTAWAACGNGIFWLDSAGIWQKSLAASGPFWEPRDLEISSSGRIAVLIFQDKERIWLSQDAGATWQETVAAPHFINSGPQKMEWIGENLHVSNGYDQTSISQDFGQTWSPSNSGPLVTVDFKGKTYGLAENKLYKSIDGGQTWQNGGGPLIFSIPAQPPKPYGLFATADRLFLMIGSVYRLLYFSTDGTTWKKAGDGLPEGRFRDYSFYDEPYFPKLFERGGRHFFYGPDMGFFTSLDTLKTWLPVDPTAFTNIAVGDSSLFSGFGGGGVLAASLPKNYGALSRGQIFNDANANGLRDAGEKALPRTQIGMTEPNAWFPFWTTMTDSAGLFAIGSLPGSADTLRPLLFSKYVDGVFPPFRLVDSSGDGRDFGLHFQPNMTDASLLGWQNRPRPGFGLNVFLFYENAGTLPVDGKIGLRLDPNFEFLNAEPPPSGSVGSDSLFWDVSGLDLFEKGSIQLFGKTKSTAPLGSPFRMRGSFSTAAPDAFWSDNFFEKVDTIRGSFDPNEKKVEPAAGLTRAQIAAGKPLFYEILFQNTGNSVADRVRIADQLDTSLDWATLRLVAASHSVTAFRLLAGGLLEVDFQNILLPDSGANEAASHGFVRFSIERKKAFAPSWSVQNRASIYFDFNEPIRTNTVWTPVIEPTTAVFEPFSERAKAAFLKISPNPATDFLTVEADGKLAGAGRVEFLDASGKCVLTILAADLARPVRAPVSRLGSGIFVVRAWNEKGEMVGKAVVR